MTNIIFEEGCCICLLLVDRTVSGKSLVLFLTAMSVCVCGGGRSLVLVPLLALTASHLAKLNAALKQFGMVQAAHLDKASPGDNAGEVIPKLDVLSPESSKMLILIFSPQCLVANPSLLAALVRCRDQRMLRRVALNKAHLWAMHRAACCGGR